MPLHAGGHALGLAVLQLAQGLYRVEGSQVAGQHPQPDAREAHAGHLLVAGQQAQALGGQGPLPVVLAGAQAQLVAQGAALGVGQAHQGAGHAHGRAPLVYQQALGQGHAQAHVAQAAGGGVLLRVHVGPGAAVPAGFHVGPKPGRNAQGGFPVVEVVAALQAFPVVLGAQSGVKSPAGLPNFLLGPNGLQGRLPGHGVVLLHQAQKFGVADDHRVGSRGLRAGRQRQQQQYGHGPALEFILRWHRNWLFWLIF